MQAFPRRPEVAPGSSELERNSAVALNSHAGAAKLHASNLNFWYGSFQALHGITMQVYEKCVTAFIGPSGCGKSTFLRTLNRMNESVRNSRVEGEILLDGQNIFGLDV